MVQLQVYYVQLNQKESIHEMKAKYKLVDDLDLRLNHVILENPEQYEVSEDLRPTEAEREKLYQSYVRDGIFELV